MALNRTSGKKVSIRFKSDIDPSEEYEGLRSDEVFSYSGKYYEQEDGFYVIYEDSGAKASIKRKGDVFIVSNAGNAGNKMTFDEKNETTVFYQTQAGLMELLIKTRKASFVKTEEVMVLKLDYTLFYEGRLLSRYKPIIEIRFE